MLNISFNFFGLFQNYDLSVDLHLPELVINQGLSALLDYRNILKKSYHYFVRMVSKSGLAGGTQRCRVPFHVWGPASVFIKVTFLTY